MTPVDPRQLVDAMPHLAWSARADGVVDFYNARWYAYTGTTPAEMADRGWESVHRPDEVERIRAGWQVSRETGSAFEMSSPLRAADGSYRWFLTRVTPTRDAHGALARWYGTHTDIDDQHRAEQALALAVLREHEAQQDALRARNAQALQARRAAMSADVASAFALGGALDRSLQRCCQSVVDHLDAAFARVWTVDTAGTTLELRASAGQYTHIDGGHARVSVGQFKIGRVAAEKRAHVSNDVAHDPWIGDPAWAEREGLVSFAGYPLIVEDQLVGVFALFSRSTLDDPTLDALVATSSMMSVGIQRTRNEAALHESEAHYRFMTDMIPTHVWTARPDGKIDYVNQRALQYSGNRPGDSLGSGWASSLHPDDVSACLVSWSRSLASGEPYEHEFRLRRSDGEYRWHLARAMPLRDPRGEIVKWFGTNSDIEDGKRSQREHEQLIRALGQSNSDLDQVASVASHDLKAPLRGISNLAEWIDEELPENTAGKVREYLRLLRGRVTRMSALVEGVLEYSRVDRKHTEPESIAVGELLDGVIELLAAPASVRIERPSELPTVSSERVPLQQVFLNLIGNSIKHAERSDAVIRIECADIGDAYDFAVCDNGPGIALADQERVWGMFHTLKSRDQVESTGIGLAVVKKLVTSRGGRVWIDSEPGRGAEFHFTWPKCHAPDLANERK